MFDSDLADADVVSLLKEAARHIALRAAQDEDGHPSRPEGLDGDEAGSVAGVSGTGRGDGPDGALVEVLRAVYLSGALDPLSAREVLSAEEVLEVAAAFQWVEAWAAAGLRAAVSAIYAHRPRTESSGWVPGRAQLRGPGVEEAATRLGLSQQRAGSLAAEGYLLADSLQDAREAMVAGLIDSGKVSTLSDALVDQPLEVCGAVCDRVLPEAPVRSHHSFAKLVARAVIEADPRSADDCHREARDKRCLGRVRVRANGMGQLTLYAPLPDVVAVDVACESAARAAHANGDGRTLEQLRADALTTMAVDAIARGSAAADPSFTATVMQVAKTWRDLTEPPPCLDISCTGECSTGPEARAAHGGKDPTCGVNIRREREREAAEAAKAAKAAESGAIEEAPPNDAETPCSRPGDTGVPGTAQENPGTSGATGGDVGISGAVRNPANHGEPDPACPTQPAVPPASPSERTSQEGALNESASREAAPQEVAPGAGSSPGSRPPDVPEVDDAARPERRQDPQPPGQQPGAPPREQTASRRLVAEPGDETGRAHQARKRLEASARRDFSPGEEASAGCEANPADDGSSALGATDQRETGGGHEGSGPPSLAMQCAQDAGAVSPEPQPPSANDASAYLPPHLRTEAVEQAVRLLRSVNVEPVSDSFRTRRVTLRIALEHLDREQADPHCPADNYLPADSEEEAQAWKTVAWPQHPAPELLGFGALGPEAARELAVDPPQWVRVETDAVPGATQGPEVWRPGCCPGSHDTGYEIPAAMRRDVENAFPTCVAPMCGVPAARCDLDHVVPWPAGPTCPCNLRPLCRRHHRLKTFDGFQLAVAADGTTSWATPMGQRIDIGPDGRRRRRVGT